MKCTSMNLQVCSSIQCKMADLCKTDLQKVISYLDEAAKIYDACPCRNASAALT